VARRARRWEGSSVSNPDSRNLDPDSRNLDPDPGLAGSGSRLSQNPNPYPDYKILTLGEHLDPKTL
jgi:hypothetical protein